MSYAHEIARLKKKRAMLLEHDERHRKQFEAEAREHGMSAVQYKMHLEKLYLTEKEARDKAS